MTTLDRVLLVARARDGGSDPATTVGEVAADSLWEVAGVIRTLGEGRA